MIFRRITDDDFCCHWGPVFLAGSDGQRGNDCLDVLFCRFPHIFRDVCEGFGCFRRSFGPSGPSARGGSKTQGEHHVHFRPPPWLHTSLQARLDVQNETDICRLTEQDLTPRSKLICKEKQNSLSCSLTNLSYTTHHGFRFRSFKQKKIQKKTFHSC